MKPSYPRQKAAEFIVIVMEDERTSEKFRQQTRENGRKYFA